MSVDATGGNGTSGYSSSASQTDDRASAFAKLTDVYREMADVYDELADVYRAKAEGRSDAEIDREIQETWTELGQANAAMERSSGAPPAALSHAAAILADIQTTVARLSRDDADEDAGAVGDGGDRELTDAEHVDLFKELAGKAGNDEIGPLIEMIFSDNRYSGLRAFLKEGDNLEVTKLLLGTPGLLERAMRWEPAGWGEEGYPLDDPSTHREFSNWVIEERGMSLSASADMDDE